MIRTIALAAAAAAVGYIAGQRAAESPESRFSRPEVTGDDVSVDPDDVVVKDGEATLSDGFVDSHRSKSWEPPEGYDPFEQRPDDDEVIGR